MEDILTYHFETNFIVKELKSTGEAKLLNYNVIDSNHINVIIKVPNGNSSVTLEFASISGVYSITTVKLGPVCLSPHPKKVSKIKM